MKYQRTILLTLLFSLGVLLSACDLSESPSNELAEKPLGGLVAVENSGGLATEAISDGFWVCLYPDADYIGVRQCYLDEGAEGETSGFFATGQIPEIVNDRVSSVEIKPGLTVELFTEPEFQGESIVLTSDSNYVGDALNDKISSFRIIVPASESEQ